MALVSIGTQTTANILFGFAVDRMPTGMAAATPITTDIVVQIDQYKENGFVSINNIYPYENFGADAQPITDVTTQIDQYNEKLFITMNKIVIKDSYGLTYSNTITPIPYQFWG